MAKVFFLVLTLYQDALTTIPRPYSTEALCQEAGKAYEGYGRRYYCIPHWSDPNARQ